MGRSIFSRDFSTAVVFVWISKYIILITRRTKNIKKNPEDKMNKKRNIFSNGYENKQTARKKKRKEETNKQTTNRIVRQHLNKRKLSLTQALFCFRFESCMCFFFNVFR